MKSLMAIIILFILVGNCYGVGEVDDISEKAPKKTPTELDSFGFGIAIGFEHFSDEYIKEAKTFGDNRIVTVTDSYEWNASLWIETHYTWDGIAANKMGLTHSAPGFFVAARLIGSDSDIFDAFGLGLLWAFKRTPLGSKAPEGQIAKSINIGVGPIWHRTRVLSDGIRDGKPYAIYQAPSHCSAMTACR